MYDISMGEFLGASNRYILVSMRLVGSTSNLMLSNIIIDSQALRTHTTLMNNTH